MIVYRHKRVVFGVNSSPFLLAAVIEHHLSKYREEKGAIARKLQSSLYVDNCVASLSSEVELDRFKKTSIAMMAEAQMDLRMWQNNVDVSSDSEDRIVSVLGMKWDRYEDVLYCDYQIPAQLPQEMTKRSILSTIQRIFDPLGILAPVTVCSKLLFQETWAQKKGWDDELEEETKCQDGSQKGTKTVKNGGRPRIVFSDNGTNFRGSVNLFRSVDWEEIRRKFLVEPIIWRFSPPSASWWGGFWERLVRSVKGLLVRVLGKSSILYEELMTILCDVEAVINNRPLTYVNEDGQDLVPLTPAMFMQGAPADGVPEVDVIEERGFQSRYRYRQILQQELRKRFRKEYLGILLQRTKDDKKNQISIGDVVFIGNDQKKRLDWQLGKVMELVPGKDGIVRVAKVKTSTGEVLRPIQRLYPTEVSGKDPILEEDKQNQDVMPRVSRFGRKLKLPNRLGVD